MARKSSQYVGEICLYGTTGSAGYIASTAVGAKFGEGRMFGDGDPVDGRSLNDAMWLAALDLRDAGCHGRVWVYDPTGRFRATLDIDHLRYFGSLDWEPAPQFVFSVEEILAAAEKPQGSKP